MSVFKVNGFDLTQYLNKEVSGGTLSGSNRQISLKRQFLHEAIQRLPEDFIERIFDDHNSETERIPKITDSLTGEPEADNIEDNVCYDTGRCRIFKCSKCGYGLIDVYLEDEDNFNWFPQFCPWCGRPVANRKV